MPSKFADPAHDPETIFRSGEFSKFRGALGFYGLFGLRALPSFRFHLALQETS